MIVAVSEEGTWDDWAQRVYLTWLVRDIRYARLALAEVRHRMSRRPPDPLLWMPLETFLMFSAKVSKMLKPIQNKPRPGQVAAYRWREARGQHLRRLLEVDDKSPVLGREVRNASEHFDEYLDEWMASAPRVTAEQVERGELPAQPSPPMRRVDSVPLALEVAGQRLDLEAIDAELALILDRAVSVEPLAAFEDPGLATLVAAFPPLPAELRLDAPTRRPNESVLAGVDPDAIAARQREWDDMWAHAVEAFSRAPDDSDEPDNIESQ
jgi:hypothetical protein